MTASPGMRVALAPGFPRQKTKRPVRRARLRLADRCDTVFSQLVRRQGRCVECGATRDLECAHGFPRRYRATRWDFRNAWCLCHDCHAHFTREPDEWERWMLSRLGIESFAELFDLAHGLTAEPLDDVWARLRELERRAS